MQQDVSKFAVNTDNISAAVDEGFDIIDDLSKDSTYPFIKYYIKEYVDNMEDVYCKPAAFKYKSAGLDASPDAIEQTDYDNYRMLVNHGTRYFSNVTVAQRAMEEYARSLYMSAEEQITSRNEYKMLCLDRMQKAASMGTTDYDKIQEYENKYHRVQDEPEDEYEDAIEANEVDGR